MTPKTRQVLQVTLAAIIILTAIARAWFSTLGLSIGLWGIEVCDHGCHGIRWDNVPGAEDDLYLAGYVAVAAMIVGAAATVWVALGNTGAVRFARIVLTVAIAAIAYFIVRALVLDGLDRVHVGWAMFAGPVATVMARLLLPKI